MRFPLPLLTPLLIVPNLYAAEISVNHEETARKVLVSVDGGPFTALVYNTHAKPILFPVHGPDGVTLTRNWPMVENVSGEDKDHPHHKSLSFTHGSVNGVDFWAEGTGKGRIVTEKISKAAVEAGVGVIEARNRWTHGEKTICTDVTTIRCAGDASGRTIDFTIVVTASEGDVVFGDTKEGSMAMRTRPEFNLKGTKNPLAAGQCVNSEGVSGAAIWAKNARWVHYWAPVSGKVLGIALFDHPSNLRHPTTWHARDYGLIAANPFGLHDFSKGQEPKGAGDFTLKKGESQTWRYRWVFHEGEANAQKLNEAWVKWSAL